MAGGAGVDVCVRGGAAVAVGVGMKTGVAVNVLDGAVPVGDGRGGGGVAVSVLDVSVGDGSGSSVGGALVGVSFAVGVSVGKKGVLVGVSGCGAFAGIHKSRQINNNKRRRATTSLKRS